MSLSAVSCATDLESIISKTLQFSAAQTKALRAGHDYYFVHDVLAVTCLRCLGGLGVSPYAADQECELIYVRIGDIPSMDEQEERSVVRREDGSFLLDGALSVNQLKQTLHLKQLPGEEDGSFQTLGGFLMTRLGRVPAPADHVEFGGWRFEIMDMDRRRVDKMLATRAGPG